MQGVLERGGGARILSLHFSPPQCAPPPEVLHPLQQGRYYYFDCKKQSDVGLDDSDVCVLVFFLSFVNAARLTGPEGGGKEKKNCEDYFTVSEGENGGRRRL